MAQVGDTITYTYSDGKSVAEDVFNVDEVFVEYCDAPGGTSNGGSGGAGGRVENATIDVSNRSTIYIWVGTDTVPSGSSAETGRYGDYNTTSGTTEIALVNTGEEDSDDEPFLVGSGAGGGGAYFGGSGGDTDVGFGGIGGVGGARGGNGGQGTGLGIDGPSDTSTPPPAGGDGGDVSNAGEDGDGAIDDQNRGLVSGGTTIQGGGSSADADGEVKLSFQSSLSPPDPPSNLTAEQQ